MWPASMIVGDPAGLTTAVLLPATSFDTSAKVAASSRQSLAGADSKPDGPGVSSNRLRNASEESESMRVHWWDDDPLHLNRSRRGRAGWVVRDWRRCGDRAGIAVFRADVATHGDRHITRGVVAAGWRARSVGV